MRELAKRIAQGQAAPLLAAPTHVHGWIDPVVLVSRLQQLQERNLQPLRTDLIQTLLRIAPDRRQDALVQAMGIENTTGRILRWACGSSEGPTSADKRDYPLWIAAGRARNPTGSLSAIVGILGVRYEGLDAAEPVTYTWHATVGDLTHDGRVDIGPGLQIDVTLPENDDHMAATTRDTEGRDDDTTPQPSSPLVVGVRMALGGLLQRAVQKMSVGRWKRLQQELPTVALHDVVEGSHQTIDLQYAWLVRWMAMVWPLHLDSTYVIGIKSMLQRLDENTAITAPNLAYLDPLFETNRPWTEMSLLLLWVSLLGKNTGCRGLAINALIQGINDSRAHPQPLADVLIRLGKGGWLKSNRLAASLGEIARVSSLHKVVVVEIVQRFLTSCPQLPNNGHYLLELLRNLLTELGISIDERMKVMLEGIKGKSKAARLARSLLAVKAASDQSTYQNALLQGIASRLERAERWQETQSCWSSSVWP